MAGSALSRVANSRGCGIILVLAIITGLGVLGILALVAFGPMLVPQDAMIPALVTGQAQQASMQYTQATSIALLATRVSQVATLSSPATPVATKVATVVPTKALVVAAAKNGSSAKSQSASGNGMSDPVSTQQVGTWSISKFERLSDNPIVVGWINRLRNPAPNLWKTFPNIPNPDVSDFRVVVCEANPNAKCVPDGMEYGTYSTPFCWQSPCDIPVGAWEYRYITGDYRFMGMECKGDKVKGCMLVLINVMDQSYTWRNQYVDNGFTLRGRYFNGDALEWGIWGLVSYGSANLLNMPTFSRPGEVLNSGQPGNSGANCGVPSGCKTADVTVVVHAGDAILAILKTTVGR